MATIYYELSTGLHRGSEAIKETLPNADALNSVELDSLGWVKGVIPDWWGQIFDIEYVNGQLIIRNDPPPYWDKLGKRMKDNSLFQRMQGLRVTSLAINGIMGQISEVIGIGQDQRSLGFAIFGLQVTLDQMNAPITPAEITEAEALLESCGFNPNFFTYASNEVNPPTPPIP